MRGVCKTRNTELQNNEKWNNSSQLMQVFMAFHVIFLFTWLSTAMGYSDSSIVATAGSYSSREIKQNSATPLIRRDFN